MQIYGVMLTWWSGDERCSKDMPFAGIQSEGIMFLYTDLNDVGSLAYH